MIVSDIILQILQRIDRLEERYGQLSLEGDIKACNGLEHCIELRMRLFGIDGKNPTEPPTAQGGVIDLDRLSDSALAELISHTTPAHDSSQSLHYHDPLNSSFTAHSPPASSDL